MHYRCYVMLKFSNFQIFNKNLEVFIIFIYLFVQIKQKLYKVQYIIYNSDVM